MNALRLLRVLAIILVLLPARAPGEIMGAPSLEWLACKSDVIAVGRIVNITRPKDGLQHHDDHRVHVDCILEAEKILKGSKEKRVEFRVSGYASEQPSQMVNTTDRFLVLLQRSKEGESAGETAKNMPTSYYSPFSVISLAKPTKHVFTREMRAPADTAELLRVCREWAASPIRRSLREDAPYDSEVFRALYAGSRVFLEVPAEEKYHARFLELARSEKPGDRRWAAYELASYPGERTEEALRELLKDTTEETWAFANDQIDRFEYGIRRAALESLKSLGKAAPELPLERKPTPEEQRRFRHAAWEKSFGDALPEGWKIGSIEDGETRVIEGRERTVVIIHGTGPGGHCTFTLIPKEWNDSDLPANGSLGINGADSQGAHHFFATGTLPDEIRDTLVTYFGLKK